MPSDLCNSASAVRAKALRSDDNYCCWACGKFIPKGEERVKLRRRDGRRDGYGAYHPTCEPPR